MDYSKIFEDAEAAARFEHPERKMRVTLDCGHFRLMMAVDCLLGIGASTKCNICTEEKGRQITRTVVNQEETGVL